MSGVFKINRVAQTVPAIPSVALANGFTNNIFFDDFNSLRLFDMGITRKGGYNWYIGNTLNYQGSPVNEPANPAWFSTSNSILTVTSNNTVDQGSEISSFADIGSGNSIQSMTIDGSKGGYIEGKMQWNPSPTTDYFVFWIEDLPGYLSSINNTNLGHKWAEVDIFENLTNLSLGVVEDLNVWSGPSTFVSNLNSSFSLNTYDLTQYHTWSILWKTRAQTGGSGFLKWYVDGSQVGSGITWANSTDNGVQMESGQFVMMFCAGVTSSLKVDYIGVWQ